ncbi:hypothetical protein J2Z40_000561 [Cytobacillus eiseniae]|uniref:Copper amine oxidase-like N-terminal domain-containing protein n=1 Tax=Cytobacillus eiseniae TaxID=762947 RepID=A0ABS4RAU4_9BACI|nr:stalk domain-containing protein [Cytobacillus eiseniae]MBP2240008.1 hypothetical protein [Cytobacillus eiseniae]
MWRTASLIFVVLTTAIGGMLSWQWKAYSKQDNHINEDAVMVEQEITVESSEKDLHITQVISGLSAKKPYQVIIPNDIFDWSCTDENGGICESKDEDPQTLIPNHKEMIFQYKIPIENSHSAFLLENWTITIFDVKINSSDIEIIDTIRREGTWIVGAPKKGIKELDFIDYYLFTAVGDAPALYWQPIELFKSINENDIAFFTEQKDAEKKSSFMVELDSLGDFPYVSVVFTNEIGEKMANGMIFTSPNTNEDNLKRKFIQYYYEWKFGGFSVEEEWILDVFTSYKAKLQPITNKAKAILNELTEKLSEEELTSFFNYINNETREINAEKLDQFIYQIKGLHTYFFKMNTTEHAKFYPLYYYDTRSVYIADTKNEEIEVIYDHGTMLYPFVETIKGFGFEVSELQDQEMMLVIRENSTYRFYLNKNIFIYNEEDYGLLENPLTKLNGKYYISKEWLKMIFNVQFKEGEQEIKLSL